MNTLNGHFKWGIKTPFIKILFQVNFRRAAAAGDLGTVQRLIDEESVDINCAGRNGATALHKVLLIIYGSYFVTHMHRNILTLLFRQQNIPEFQ